MTGQFFCPIEVNGQRCQYVDSYLMLTKHLVTAHHLSTTDAVKAADAQLQERAE